jgi:hypothetical protein
MCKKLKRAFLGVSKRKQPPPVAPVTRSNSRPTYVEAFGSTPGKDLVAPIFLDNTMASIRSKTSTC